MKKPQLCLVLVLFVLEHLLQAMLTSMAALCLVQTIAWRYVRDVNKAHIILTWEWKHHREGYKLV